jgi:hypothetical protein
MIQARRQKINSVAVARLGLLALLVAGCYKPAIESGGLRCATSGKACPDGFACLGGLCVSTSGTAGSGSSGASGGGGRSGSGGTPGGSGGANGVDSGAPRGVGETCTIMNRGQMNQSDDCETGSVCMDDCLPQSHCYHVCGSDNDCPTSACTRMFGAVRICEISFGTCDPKNGHQGCDAADGCYLLSSEPAPAGGDRIVCDCSMDARAPGEACTDSRQCIPGLVCPPATALGGGVCRYVCDTTAAASGCAVNLACFPFGTKWGYCLAP